MEEIWHEGGRLIDGLKWSSGEDGAHLQVVIFEKESEEGGERRLLDGRGKRTSSMLNLAPTKSGYLAIVGIEDFWLKESNAATLRDASIPLQRVVRQLYQ